MMNLITNEPASALSNDDKSLIILGVDHGYGNIKTANFCFHTSVDQYETRPDFARHVLEYNDHFYVIGEGHKEYRSDKMNDDDYYLLTLAAIARELNLRHVTDAAVFVAAGLPLTWLGSQKETFRQYLLRDDHADFRFDGKDYHVRFAGADIFPKGLRGCGRQAPPVQRPEHDRRHRQRNHEHHVRERQEARRETMLH